MGGAKRPRSGAAADLKRAAEIVMVLSAMGEMRAGRNPSVAEKSLAAEARELLAGMCEEMRPKDLFSRDAVRVVVEDLGLNRSVGQGARPPKMSIADKMLHTKKRMEEQKELATLHPPQPLPVGYGANSEFHGSVFHGAPRFLPDRPNPMALHARGFQNASAAVRVPDLASASTSLKHSHVNGTQPAATCIMTAAGPLVNHSSLNLPRTETAHSGLDARSSGPAYLAQVRAENAPAKTSSTPLQSTSASTAKLGQENKLLDHPPLKSKGVHDGYAFQSSHPVVNSQGVLTSIQTTPGNLLIGHQPSQGLTYAHATSCFTNHNEIAKSVQRFLQQSVSRHPNWTLPSIDYMNNPLNCQICKILINDVENVLVCDTCEKGTHLKCLQSYGYKGVPNAEWYCPKCVIASNGRSFPPKYGRVTRSVATPNVTSNPVGTRASPEKRVEHPDAGVNKKSEPNGNASMPYLVYASNMVSSHSRPASDSKATSAREMQNVDLPSTGTKREDGMHAGASTNPSKERDGMVCASSDTQNESSVNQVANKGISSSDMQRSSHESILESKAVSYEACPKYQNEISEAADQQVCNRMEVLSSAEASENQLHEVTEPNDELKPCGQGGIPKYEGDHDIMPNDMVNSLAAPNGVSDSGDAAIDCGRVLPLDSPTVDWVGDILEAVEGKSYYQSCSVNGALYKLDDHVLISSNSQNLFPSKLQSLWEDKQTRSKWATVDTYYFPSDLSEVVNRPSTPENHEVYAANNRSTIMVSSILGPCEVISVNKFREESDRRDQLGDTNNDLHPIFMCRWLYDESKSVFQPVAY